MQISNLPSLEAQNGKLWEVEESVQHLEDALPVMPMPAESEESRRHQEQKSKLGLTVGSMANLDSQPLLP